MIRSLDNLIKIVGIIIIPIGIALFVQAFFFNGGTFRESITSMVAAVIGMIPEGLYLLASVAEFAVKLLGTHTGCAAQSVGGLELRQSAHRGLLLR